MGSTAKSGQMTVFGGWVFFGWAQKNVRWFCCYEVANHFVSISRKASWRDLSKIIEEAVI